MEVGQFPKVKIFPYWAISILKKFRTCEWALRSRRKLASNRINWKLFGLFSAKSAKNFGLDFPTFLNFSQKWRKFKNFVKIRIYKWNSEKRQNRKNSNSQDLILKAIPRIVQRFLVEIKRKIQGIWLISKILVISIWKIRIYGVFWKRISI